jgi:hypothetical protein
VWISADNSTKQPAGLEHSSRAKRKTQPISAVSPNGAANQPQGRQATRSFIGKHLLCITAGETTRYDDVLLINMTIE